MRINIELKQEGLPLITITVPIVARPPVRIICDKARSRLAIDGLSAMSFIPAYALADVLDAMKMALDIIDGNILFEINVEETLHEVATRTPAPPSSLV